MLDLADNPLILTLAGASPYDYMWEVSLFLLYLQLFEIIRSETKRELGYRLLDLLKVGVRAFSGCYFLVPMVLGQLPSPIFTNVDRYFGVYVAAVVVFVNVRPHVPEKFWCYISPFMKLAYAIHFSEACVTATMGGALAFPNSRCAPLMLGFLAVCGGSMVELGYDGVWRKDYTKDQLLGLLGPTIFFFFTGVFVEDIKCSEQVARCIVVLFRLSCESKSVDYNEVLNYLTHVRIEAMRNLTVARAKRT